MKIGELKIRDQPFYKRINTTRSVIGSLKGYNQIISLDSMISQNFWALEVTKRYDTSEFTQPKVSGGSASQF